MDCYNMLPGWLTWEYHEVFGLVGSLWQSQPVGYLQRFAREMSIMIFWGQGANEIPIAVPSMKYCSNSAQKCVLSFMLWYVQQRGNWCLKKYTVNISHSNITISSPLIMAWDLRLIPRCHGYKVWGGFGVMTQMDVWTSHAKTMEWQDTGWSAKCLVHLTCHLNNSLYVTEHSNIPSERCMESLCISHLFECIFYLPHLSCLVSTPDVTAIA